MVYSIPHYWFFFCARTAFPSSFVWNGKKKSFVPYIGGFNEPDIKEFLDKVLRGAKKASPITGELPSIQPVEDIPLPPAEEEAESENKKDEL